MNKNNLVKYDIENAKPEKALQDLKEMFSKFDLKDNNSIIFNACVERIETELKSLNKTVSELKTKSNKEEKSKTYYKEKLMDKLTKKDIIKLLEERVE